MRYDPEVAPDPVRWLATPEQSVWTRCVGTIRKRSAAPRVLNSVLSSTSLLKLSSPRDM